MLKIHNTQYNAAVFAENEVATMFRKFSNTKGPHPIPPVPRPGTDDNTSSCYADMLINDKRNFTKFPQLKNTIKHNIIYPGRRQ
jgi:hypothetical protein